MKEIDVLDHGYVKLVGFMGGDDVVVETARISYQSKGDSDSNKNLIKFLLEHRHGTPFEHTVFRFKMRMPIFVMRHFVRYRHASISEKSMRYTVLNNKDAFYIETGDSNVDAILDENTKSSISRYDLLIKSSVPPEIARCVLPVNAYTEFYWTLNARSLMHILEERISKSAQRETREYAIALYSIFKEVMPITSSYFSKYIPEEFIKNEA